MNPQRKHSLSTKKESILGITSSGLALITLACFVILLLSATYFETATPGGMNKNSPVAIIIGLLLLIILASNFLGAVLGFIGIFQASKRKTFPVIGAFLNSLILVGLIVLVLFSLLSQ